MSQANIEPQESVEEYMLQIREKVTDFRAELQTDIEMTDYNYPTNILAARIQKLDFSDARTPSYLDYSWRINELTK